MDPTLVDAGEFRIGDHLAVEVQPLRIVSGQPLPELDEPHQFARLIGAGQIGVGIAQDPALGLLGEEAEDAGTRLAAAGQEVVVQGGGIAPERDGMEVQREDLPLGEQQWCQGGDPAGEELLLVAPLGAVGVVGGERGLGQDVEAREEAEGLVEVEVADVTAPFLVEQLQGEQAQQGGGGGHHLRAGIARTLDDLVEAEASQQGQEEEDPGDPSPQAASRGEVQPATIRHGRGFRGDWRERAVTLRSPRSGCREKGGTRSSRHRARKSPITSRRVL